MSNTNYRRPKDTVIIYRSWIENISDMPIEEQARLLLAAAAYEMDGIEPTFDDASMAVAFRFMQFQLDADYAKWLAQCERNKQNRNASKSRNQSSPAVTNGTDKETVEDEEEEIIDIYRGKQYIPTMEEKVNLLDPLIDDIEHEHLADTLRCADDEEINDELDRLNRKYHQW